MTKPIIAVKNQLLNSIVILVDVNYADSICLHLKEKQVNFKRSKIVLVEPMWDENKQPWEFVTNEIVVERNISDFANLLSGWFISSVGL